MQCHIIQYRAKHQEAISKVIIRLEKNQENGYKQIFTLSNIHDIFILLSVTQLS